MKPNAKKPPKPTKEAKQANSIKPNRGPSITIHSKGSHEVTDEAIIRGRIRRKCELAELARELGGELMEVWE